MSDGRNTHHILEASFKGVARALRDAVRIEGGGRPVHQGHAVSPVRRSLAGDRRPRLRHRQPPLGREGPPAPRGRCPPGRPTRTEAAAADGVVLPGVGRLRPCVEALRPSGPRPGGRRRRSSGACRSSASASGCSCSTRGPRRIPAPPGLGVLPGRGPPAARRRQAAPDAVEPARAARPGRPRPAGRARTPSRGSTSSTPTPRRAARRRVATCDYGGPVTAAAERGPVWGTQFHPEKSGRVGPGASWPTSWPPAVDRAEPA